MHSHEHHSLLQPLDRLIAQFRDFLHRSAKQLFPGSFAPEQFARRNASRFVQERANNLGVEVELQRLGAVFAGYCEAVCVYGNPTTDVEKKG